MVLIILLLQFIKCEEVSTYMLLQYNMQYGHAANYLLLLPYIKCRSPVYVTASNKVQTGCCVYVSAILHKLCCYLSIATLYE